MLVLSRQSGQAIIVRAGELLFDVMVTDIQPAQVHVVVTCRNFGGRMSNIVVEQNCVLAQRLEFAEAKIEIIDFRGEKVRIGISAPSEYEVHRREVWEARQRERGDEDGLAGAPVPR